MDLTLSRFLSEAMIQGKIEDFVVCSRKSRYGNDKCGNDKCGKLMYRYGLLGFEFRHFVDTYVFGQFESSKQFKIRSILLIKKNTLFDFQ